MENGGFRGNPKRFSADVLPVDPALFSGMGRKMGQVFRGMGQRMGQTTGRVTAIQKERQISELWARCGKPISGIPGFSQKMGQSDFSHTDPASFSD